VGNGGAQITTVFRSMLSDQPRDAEPAAPLAPAVGDPEHGHALPLHLPERDHPRVIGAMLVHGSVYASIACFDPDRKVRAALRHAWQLTAAAPSRFAFLAAPVRAEIPPRVPLQIVSRSAESQADEGWLTGSAASERCYEGSKGLWAALEIKIPHIVVAVVGNRSRAASEERGHLLDEDWVVAVFSNPPLANRQWLTMSGGELRSGLKPRQ